VKESGWAPFKGKLWQRNYYEHVMRNAADHERIYNYIDANPSQWIADEENPARA
jgi:putative transposase